MQILFVGDIVGKPGRQCLRLALPILVEQYGVDIVVANVENAAGGMGVTRKVAEAIRDMGVDVMTSGNHIWDKKEALSYVDLEPRMIRPANYPDAPGSGHYVARTQAGVTLGVINLMGRVFMNPLDNPFQVVPLGAGVKPGEKVDVSHSTVSGIPIRCRSEPIDPEDILTIR